MVKLPDGPRTPSFLQILRWVTRPSDFLNSCTERYGDIFTANFPGNSPTVFISSPEALEEILSAPLGTFNSGEQYQILQPMVGKHSLMVLDGKPHQHRRRLLTPPFHGDRLRVYSQLICSLTQQRMQQLKVGVPFNASSCIQEISQEVILRTVFGLNEGDRLTQLRQKFILMLNYMTSPVLVLHLLFRPLQRDWGFVSIWGRFVKLRNEIDRLLYAEIAQRHQRSQPERTDILSLLMAARDEDGKAMSDQELRDELMTLFVSGQHTTTTAIIWALYWIHKFPEVQQRLLDELDAINDITDPNTISQLPYLTAVCQETLRFYPPIVVAASRILKTPLKIMGYEFPVGSHLVPNIYSAHHRQEVYQDPEEFRPERFLEQQFSPYEYLPFGGGNRHCIGNAFAQLEMKLVLATILSSYQLALADERPLVPVRSGPGLAPSKDVQMIITAQRHRPLRQNDYVAEPSFL